MNFLGSRLRLGLMCGVAGFALAVGCGDNDELARALDSGEPTPDAGEPAPDGSVAGATVFLAPSGALVGPAATVMTSGNYRMVTSMGSAGSARATSDNYELRGTAADGR